MYTFVCVCDVCVYIISVAKSQTRFASHFKLFTKTEWKITKQNKKSVALWIMKAFTFIVGFLRLPSACQTLSSNATFYALTKHTNNKTFWRCSRNHLFPLRKKNTFVFAHSSHLPRMMRTRKRNKHKYITPEKHLRLCERDRESRKREFNEHRPYKDKRQPQWQFSVSHFHQGASHLSSFSPISRNLELLFSFCSTWFGLLSLSLFLSLFIFLFPSDFHLLFDYDILPSELCKMLNVAI